MKLNSKLQVQKENRTNIFGRSAFAKVFKRAKHAGAIVLHMHLWTHNTLFNIDL